MEKKSVIVTGGAQGIGKITVISLHVQGYQVTALDCDSEALVELKEKWPDIGTIFADVSNEVEVSKAIQSVGNSLFGVVNNAAVSANKPFGELTVEEWNRVLAVNLTSVFLTSKYAFPLLKTNKGAIVNIASTRAVMSEPHTEAYSASKGAILSLTHAMAMSMGPDVRVNAISPGWIETGHLKKQSANSKVHHTAEDLSQHPVGRVGTADDIAGMVVYLLSEKAGFITGQNFVIDGGMTKKMIYV